MTVTEGPRASGQRKVPTRRMAFEDALAVPMTGAERKELVEAVLRWLEYHTGSRIDLRSVAVLHQIAKIR